MTEQAKSEARQEATAGRTRGFVGTPFTLSTVPTWGVPATSTEAEDFTEGVFEDKLDRVSRPLKGRFAHVPYSSEDLIREKRTEAELEDRSS